MTIRTTFPRPVREIENLWLPLPDGARLAARIWLPADAESHPVPALFEFLPYRKSDGTCAAPTTPGMATPCCAWTCAAAATPTAC